MALFKILKGAGNLPTTKTEGWAYVKKTGNNSADFYVDYDGDTRLKINYSADVLTGKPSMTIVRGQSDGPVLTITAGGKTSDEKTFPKATDTQSGVVTTADQIFAGNKFTKGTHIGLVNGGEADQFLDFAYTGDPTTKNTKAPGASWRIGALNSGSGDSNYFVVQTGGSDTNATVWNNAIQIGMNTLDMTLGGDLLPKATNTLTIGTADLKWKNIYATTFTGNLTGIADYASRWSSSRTVTFAKGDVTGSFSINGEANVDNVVLTVVDDSHNHIIANVDGLADDLSLAKKSAGSTDTNNKIFLVGATSQTTTSQTYSHDTVYVDTDGNLNTNALMINTTGAPSIKFARTSYNYLLAPANGSLAFCAANSAALADSGLVVNSSGAIPGATDKFNLGTSKYRWNNIVGKTLTGDFIKGGQVSGSIILERKSSDYTSSIPGHIWIST